MRQLHGRSRQQRYTKLADWTYIKQCVDTVRAKEAELDREYLIWSQRTNGCNFKISATCAYLWRRWLLFLGRILGKCWIFRSWWCDGCERRADQAVDFYWNKGKERVGYQLARKIGSHKKSLSLLFLPLRLKLRVVLVCRIRPQVSDYTLCRIYPKIS